ncbi:MAG: M15 family metallopeptidase [Ruminococcus sp.]|nr:M15 family metallopeptidase [Ruminococcus sp.]
MAKNKKSNAGKIAAEVIIAAVVIAAGGYLIKSAADRSKVVEPSQYTEEAQAPAETVTTTEAPDPNKIVYTTKTVVAEDMYAGDLILVNNDYQYHATGEEELVCINELLSNSGITCFSAYEWDYSILAQVYQPMTDMTCDYYDNTGDDTLTIFGSYRTTDFQAILYNNDLANTGNEESTRVAKPGYSEHETGLAFDYSELIDLNFDGTGAESWITENCYKYGFILRYPENKEELTYIQYEPWHFRYVGFPHAYYMTMHDLCLEEYTDLIRTRYPYSGEHLELTAEGADYEIYYYPADGSGSTELPVPSGYVYDVSGNNVDGFVVTVHKSERINESAAGQIGETPAAEDTQETEEGAADEDTVAAPDEDTAE